jgi:hypothetical protein
MGASLFKALTVSHYSSSTQFVPRRLCAEEIFTLQLPPPAIGLGSSISLSLSLSLSLSISLKNGSFSNYIMIMLCCIMCSVSAELDVFS